MQRALGGDGTPALPRLSSGWRRPVSCSEEHPWRAPKSPPLTHTAPCTTHLAKRGPHHQTR
eukprot:6124380-Prymnesium_polylepis.1